MTKDDSLRIVLIDDDVNIRLILKKYFAYKFQNANYTLYTSNNGVEGLGYAFITSPQIIIIDSTLPKYSGRELVDYIITNPKFKDSKVIALTDGNSEITPNERYTLLNKQDEEFLTKLTSELGISIAYNRPTNKWQDRYSRLLKYLSQKVILLSNKSSITIEENTNNIFENVKNKIEWISQQIDESAYLALFSLFIGRKSKDENLKQDKTDMDSFRVRAYPTLASIFLLFFFIVIQIGAYFGGLLSITIFTPKPVAAASYTWDGGGTTNNFSDCNNWSTNVCPVAADTITFNNTSVKNATIDAGWGGTLTTFTISTNYTGTITLSRSLTVSGTLSQSSGTINSGAQTVSLGGFTLGSTGIFNATSGTMTISGGFTKTAGAGTFNHNNGTVVLSGSTATINCGNATIFNFVSFTGQTNTKTINQCGTFNVGNNPVIPNSVSVGTGTTFSGTGQINLSAGTFTLTINGAVSGFTGFNSAGTLSVAGTFNAGSYNPFVTVGFTQTGGTFTAPSGNMGVSGTFNVSGGTFNNNGGAVIFSGGTATLTCTGVTFNLVSFSGQTGVKTVNSSCTLPLATNPTIPNGISLSGVLTGSGTLTFTTGTLTIANSTASITNFTNITHNSNVTVNANIDLSAITTLTVVGTFNQTAGTYTGPTTSDLAVVTISGGIHNASATTTISSTFTISGSPTFNANSGIVNFDGTAAAVLTCNSATFNLVRFTHTTNAKTVGSSCTLPLDTSVNITGSITLAGTLSGSGTATMSAGTLTLNAGASFSTLTGLIVPTLTVTGSTYDFSTNFTTFQVTGVTTVTSGTITFPNNANLDGNLVINGGTANPTGNLYLAGNFSHTSGTFNDGTSNIIFDGSSNNTIATLCTTVTTCTSQEFYNITIAKSVITATVTTTTNHVRVANTLTITSGTFVQTTLNVLSNGSSAISVASGGRWTNTSTGDVIIGGTVVNNGLMTWQGTTASCGEADAISVTSTSSGVQRAWSGTGTFSFNDLSVQDQGGSSSIVAQSSTSVSGNNSNWLFNGCNTVPAAPTSLTQKTVSNTTISNGAWTNQTSIKFGATATDPNNPDTLFLCVEIQPLATPFTNIDTSCSTSGTSYSGSGISIEHTISSISDAQYHWQARTKDLAGGFSTWVTYASPGPNLHWKFDEGTGTSTTADSSGNGLTGTLNSITNGDWVTGQYGTALQFDGTNDYVSRADNALLSPSGGITYELWFNLDVTASSRSENHTLMEHDHSASPYRSFDLFIDSSNNRLTSTLHNQAGTGVFLQGSTSIAASTWYHAAVSWDGTTARLYLDGTQVASSALSGTSVFNADSQFTVGDGDGGFGFETDGKIDDVRIYGYGRSASQITDDMNNSGGSFDFAVDGTAPTGGTIYDGSSVGVDDDDLLSSTDISGNWDSFNFDISGISSYDYSIGTSPGGTDVKTWTANTTLTSATATGLSLSSGNTYYFNVRANDIAGNNSIVSSDGQSIPSSGTNPPSAMSQTNNSNVAIPDNQWINQSTVKLSALLSDPDSSDTLSLCVEVDVVGTAFSNIEDACTSGSAYSGNPILLTYTASGLGDNQYHWQARTKDNSGNYSSWVYFGDIEFNTSAYLQFNENTGTSASDLSGNSNTGTLTGGATWGSGKLGTAVSLDGSDDYVNVANESHFDFERTQAFSMGAWVNRSSSSSYDEVIAKMDTTANGNRGYRLLIEPSSGFLYAANSVIVDITSTISTNWIRVNTSTGIPASSWTHVEATYDGSGSASGVKIYINGVQQSTTVQANNLGSNTILNNVNLMVGRNGDSPANYFHGLIDDVRVYKRALSSTEVFDLYNAAQPIAFWKFDECAGSNITDWSGYGNTATLTIGAGGTQASAGNCSTSSTAWGNGALGKYSSAMNFDGTDDVVDGGSANIIDDLGPVTYEAWFNANSLGEGGLGRIFEKQSSTTANGYRLQLNSSNSIIFAVDYSGTDIERKTVNSAFSFSTWNHIVVTWDGTSNASNIKMYLNGTEVSYATAINGTGSRNSDNLQNFRIGNTSDGSRTFDGKIDNVKIYNSILSASQVSSLYAKGSYMDYGVDTTQPTSLVVYDGTSTGVDTAFNDGSLSSLSANWSGLNANISGANGSGYEYSIGTSPGDNSVKDWTNVGTDLSVTSTGLTLSSSIMYYFNVRVTDNAGNTATFSSNGQYVAPTLSFTISSSNISFDNLNTSNSFTDTKTTTLTTSTNAYNGYEIRLYKTGLLTSTIPSATIPDYSPGTYSTPRSWLSTHRGLGYTSNDTLVGGVNRFSPTLCFGAPPCYAPISSSAPGDVVADNTNATSGTPISNEQFTITYKVQTDATQSAGTYSTTLIYSITAKY